MIANRLLVLIALCGAGPKSTSSALAQVALSSEGQA